MGGLYNLGDLVDRSRDPEAIGLIDVGGDGAGTRSYTHAEIDAEAAAVARGLLRAGYRRGDRIGILAANRAEFLTAYLGTMRAGMVSVPINFKFPADTVSFILDDADIRLVFVDAARRAAVPTSVPVVAFGDDGPGGFAAFLDAGPFQTVVSDPGEVAMFLYTSGSTGRPKGVPLTHAGHLWVVEQRIAARLDPDHRMLVAAPLYHMNGLAICKVAMAAHLRIVLLPQFETAAYIRAIGAHGITWLTSVAAMMAMVVREEELLARIDLSSVRMVRMGSAPVSQKLIDDIRRLLPNASITNGYGTTESGPVAFGPHPKGLAQPPISIGYPVAGIGIRLVDGDDMDADYGVLHTRCPAVMPGYHNMPEKTAEVMTADGWYVTGDVMRRDENGFHYFVGRVDDMFNCGGENVYPSDVERLLERHPDIEQACVVPVPDEIKAFKPVAFVVSRDGAGLTEDAVKAFALANGPAYQHPRKVTFLPTLPLTGTNKVDRKALAARAAMEAGVG